MDIVWIAILVDMTIHGLLGFSIVKIWGKRLPASWKRKSFVIPVVLVLGKREGYPV
ncbi:MAG: hypothetical protein IR164_15320 [Devosia sp.]|uniref:hypothetical protein n=1 Tax=Devosia sp. TaxID=1871048 RepID=UPI001A0D0DF0|nr:hypothetical protein [Devosia sp.]MBF0680295.1 hypothetical protein [Devosia sp.]